MNVLESKLPSKQRKRRLNIEMSFLYMKSTFIVSYIIKKEENIMTKSMNDKELKEELLEELRCDLEEDLHGYVICDYLSRDDMILMTY